MRSLHMFKGDFINTTFGMVLAVVVTNPVRLLDTFIVGLVGAIGAYIGNMLIKWIVKVISGKRQ